MAYGVYNMDCYGLSEEETSKHLLNNFENYKYALKYAEKAGEKTAIHFVKS